MNKNSQATQEALSYTSYLALDEVLKPSARVRTNTTSCCSS